MEINNNAAINIIIWQCNLATVAAMVQRSIVLPSLCADGLISMVYTGPRK